MDGTTTIALVSTASTDRCTSIGTPLASSRGPGAAPTISTWKGAGASARPWEVRITPEPFMTSKMPNSVEANASGNATRLT